VPVAQRPEGEAMLAVRTEGDPMGLATAVRNQILAMDRDQPVTEVQSMSRVVEDSEGPLRAVMVLLAVFAAAAAGVAVVGLYGVVAYSVAQRRKEIGIRRALGAQSRDILALVVGQGLRMAIGGTALGLCTALVAMRLLRSLLFQVSGDDPLTYLGVAGLFLAVAVGASWLPARRAAGVDPMETLRIS